jgi:hypothetical protein
MGHLLGEGALCTPAEREEVWRLDEEGGSIRGIAGEVFGDRRYRGRVERILRRSRRDPAADMDAEDYALMRDFEALDLTDLLLVLSETTREPAVAGDGLGVGGPPVRATLPREELSPTLLALLERHRASIARRSARIARPAPTK